MAITPFGCVFLPVVLAILALRRRWLVPLLIVSAGLQAPAVVTIATHDGSRLGVTPWITVAFAIFLHFIARLLRHRELVLPPRGPVGWFVIGCLIYAAWAIVSAFVMPLVFEGTLTLNPEHMRSIKMPPEPLQWRLANAVGAINAAVLAMLFAYVIQVAPQPGFLRRVGGGLLIALAVSVAIGAIDRMQILGIIAPPAFFIDSLNPSYVQTSGYRLGLLTRASWPFSEPSYASAWFAAFFAAGLGLALFAPRVRLAWAVGVIGLALFGLGNSLGGSGLFGAGVSVLVLGCVALICLATDRDSSRRAWLARRLSLLGAMGLILVLAASQLHRFDALREVTPRNFSNWVIEPRLNDGTRPGTTRSAANRFALDVVARTHGLGTGLGGNRAPSYALNMASNLGVPATLFFMALLIVQAGTLARLAREHIVALGVLCGQVGMLPGLLVAIPDLHWPAWWIWLLASAGVMAAVASLRSTRIDAPA